MSLKKRKPGFDTLVLARHGTPALSRKIRLTWREFRDWWGQYDLSGLKDGQIAPGKLRELAEAADAVFSSTLPRARETAFLTRERDADFYDEVFIEAALPSPPLGPIKLRPKTWGTISRIIWFYGYHGGMESVLDARLRAGLAAQRLEQDAAGGKLVVLTGHGWFNRMIGVQLKKRGWKETVDQGDLHWKYRQYERKTDPELLSQVDKNG